jgi:predicted nicotinamide N-methyase
MYASSHVAHFPFRHAGFPIVVFHFCFSLIPDVRSLQEVSDALMNHMAAMPTVAPMAALTAAQRRSIVSYHVPGDFSSPQPVCIYIEEARNLLGAHGTTGLRVWDACLHLAHFLFSAAPSLIESKNILELGCGTGLLSIFCAGPLNARRVIATDGDAQVVQAIASNAALNAHLLEKPAKVGHFHAKVLDWADTSAPSQVLQPREGEVMPLDVVLGADITYAVDALEHLVNLFSALSDMYPKVDIIISTVVRNEDTFSAFVDTCAKAGFQVSSIPFDCPSLGQQRGFFHKLVPLIRIVRLARRPVHHRGVSRSNIKGYH